MTSNFIIKLLPKIILGLFCGFYSPSILAQIGGKAIFEFLNLSPNTRQVALGNLNISSQPDDAAIFWANPSLMGEKSGFAQMDFMPFYADINYLMASYRHNFGSWRTGVGMAYLNYGNFDAFDATGQNTGVFSANDYALCVALAHQIAPFSWGANLKIVGSQIDRYSAVGTLLDLGAGFVHPTKDLKVSFVIKNLGFAWNNYTQSQPAMPLDVQLGVSLKPKAMPLRFSLTAHHLHRFDLAYRSPNRKNNLDFNGNPIVENITWSDEFFRHLVVGTEMLFHKNFELRLGYNFMQRADGIHPEASGLTGLSFGGLIRIKGLEIAISRSLRHISGGVTAFSLALDTPKILKKRVIE